MNEPTYIERALFLMGEQDTGKSTQLRSMFLDHRLGKYGQIPEAHNLPNSYMLSNNRSLYLRLTSPHEAGEDIQEFLAKCRREMSRSPLTRRRNFAGALQISGTDDLPEGRDVIEAFVETFAPERIRAVILSPTCWGASIDDIPLLTNELREIPRCEVITVDATDRTANGLIYSDFFDFT